MEQLTNPQDIINFLLALALDESDLSKYKDLDYAIDSLVQKQMHWQALLSVGVHAAVYDHLHIIRPDHDMASQTLQVLIRRSLDPIRDFQAILDKSSDSPENLRLTLHTRFALGFLCFAKEEYEEAHKNLQLIAETEFTAVGYSKRFGSELASFTADLGVIKWLTAFLVEDHYRSDFAYEEIFELLADASHVPSEYGRLSASTPSAILDLWTDKCVRADATRNEGGLSGLPYDENDEVGQSYGNEAEWINLLAAAAEFFEVLPSEDYWGDKVLPSPRDYPRDSKEWQAWKFGWLVARYAVSDISRLHNPLAAIRDIEEYFFGTGYNFGETPSEIMNERSSKRWEILPLIASFLNSAEPQLDWTAVRLQHNSMFLMVRAIGVDDDILTEAVGEPILTEVGPSEQYYWAMRVGFSDGLLEFDSLLTDERNGEDIEPAAILSVEDDIEPTEDSLILEKLENLEIIVSATHLRQVKNDSRLTRLLEGDLILPARRTRSNKNSRLAWVGFGAIYIQ
jgi:hypothetical protein